MFPEDSDRRFRGSEAGTGQVQVAAGLNEYLTVSLDRSLK